MTFKIIFFPASRVYKTLSSVSPLWIVLHEESGTGHGGGIYKIKEVTTPLGSTGLRQSLSV